MDPKFRTSFIPKQEIDIPMRDQGEGFRFSFLSIISIVIFAIAAILAIGVFIYQKTLVGSINKMNGELVAARASFEPSFIQELITLDQRIEAAKSIVNSHSVTTPIFKILEDETLQGVRFDSFNYIVDAKGQPAITLNGEAVNLNSVALQSDVFGADERVKNPAFSSLSLDEKGIAKFIFNAGLDAQSFLYKNAFSQSGAGSTTDTGNGSGGVDITPVQ